MRSLRRALLWASVAGIWVAGSVGCSVNQAGLTDASGVAGSAPLGIGGGAGATTVGLGGAIGSGGGTATGVGGSAGRAGTSGGTGAGGAAGSTASGTGGVATGLGGDGGSQGTAGTAGTAGVAGDGGTAGAGGNAGNDGTGGIAGDGGPGAAGTSGDRGGAGGSGGIAGGAGGRGGFFGMAGRGGGGGRGGNGNGGRGGGGGNPCMAYPSAKAFVTPTDGRTHCYWLRSTSQTWSQAQQACMLQNGHLVTIQSAEENDFVVGMAPFSGQFSDTWIGATDGKAGNDKSGPGSYRWVTNEAWGYTNWQQGQPDGFCDPCSAGQTCTCDHRAVLASDGTWNDRWQDNTRSSVCEAP